MQKVNYRVTDPRQIEVAKGEILLSAMGAFDLTVTLPDNVNLGEISLSLSLEKFPAQPHVHKFHTQEVTNCPFAIIYRISFSSSYHAYLQFRRPEFVAEASVESKEPHWFEAPGPVIKANASYYAGGGLPDSDITWKVSSTEGNFIPPGWSDYSFAIPTKPLRNLSETGLACQRSITGKTRQSGDHKVRIELKDHSTPDPPRPVAIAALAEIIDINRQTLSASTQLILHPWYPLPPFSISNMETKTN